MLSLKKLSWLPYTIALILAGIFIWTAHILDTGLLRDLSINLAASFIVIPITLIFIDSIKNRVSKELRKEMFDFIKKHVDNDILSTLSHANRLFNIPTIPPYKPLSSKLLTTLLNFEESTLKKYVMLLSPLGFQIFKSPEDTRKGLSNILQNPLALKVLNVAQMTTVIQLIKNIEKFESYLKDTTNFSVIGDKSSEFKVSKGTDFNSADIKFPNRFLLLKLTKKKDTYIVSDFGDFEYYFEKSLLNQYRITDTGIINIYKGLIDLVQTINKWFELTDNELILDTKLFKTIAHTGGHL